MTHHATLPLLSLLTARSGWLTLLAALMMFSLTADGNAFGQRGNSGTPPGQNKDTDDDGSGDDGSGDEGGGGDEVGGDDDQDEPGIDPGIRYEVTVFLPPVDNLDQLRIRGLNSSGLAVGSYILSSGDGRISRPLIFDPSMDPDAAFDLNEVTANVPDGFSIRQARAINDSGLVVAHLVDNSTPEGKYSQGRYPGIVDTRETPYQFYSIPTLEGYPEGLGVDINEQGDVLVFLTEEFRPDPDEAPPQNIMAIYNHGLLGNGLAMKEPVLLPGIPARRPENSNTEFLSDEVGGELYVVMRNDDWDPIRFRVDVSSGEIKHVTLLESWREEGVDDERYEMWFTYFSPVAANRFGDFSGTWESAERRYHVRNGKLLSSEFDYGFYLNDSGTEKTEYDFVTSARRRKRVSDLNGTQDILGNAMRSLSDTISDEYLIHPTFGRFEIASLIDDESDATGLWKQRHIGFYSARISERFNNTGFPIVVGTFGWNNFSDAGYIIRDHGVLLIPIGSTE